MEKVAIEPYLDVFLIKEEESGKQVAMSHDLADAEEITACLNALPDVVLEQKVEIRIWRGVADLISKPYGIEVEIRDYDVEDCWDEDNINCKVDNEGDRYQQIVFESIVEVP